MKIANELITDLKSQQPPTTTSERPTFSDHERDVTGYFFLRLRNIYGSLFTAQYPTEDDLRMAKREYAKLIGAYSREQLAKAFDEVHRSRKLPHSDFEFVNIDKILGLCDQGWEMQCHKEYKPETLLEDKGAQERAEKAGKAALMEMKGLFAYQPEREGCTSQTAATGE